MSGSNRIFHATAPRIAGKILEQPQDDRTMTALGAAPSSEGAHHADAEVRAPFRSRIAAPFSIQTDPGFAPFGAVQDFCFLRREER